MEVYDYKKKPAKRKKEQELPKYSDTVVQNGDSYRRLTKAELKRQRKELRAEEEKKQQEKQATDELVEGIFDAIGSVFGFIFKLFPFVFMFFIFTSTGLLDGVISGFNVFLSDFGIDGTFESRVIVFIMLAVPIFVFMQSNRRYRRWF